MQECIVSISEKIIRLSYYTLFTVTPLLVCPWTHELFEFPKMMFVYTITVLVFTAYLIKNIINFESFPQMLNDKWQMINSVPLAFSILFYLFTFVLSTTFSVHPYTSIFGYYGRFHGGLLSIISYVFLSFVYITDFKGEKNGPLVTSYHLLVVGFLVSGYGILQHFGIDTHYWLQDSSARVFSTLGQPNWLAAWLVMLLPLSWFFYLSSKKFWLSAVGWLLSAVFFASFWFTYSLSGLLGGLVALLVFAALMPKRFFFRIKLRSCLLVTSYLLVVVTFPGLINRRVQELKKQLMVLPQVYAAESRRGSGDTVKIRLIVWRGALDVWKSTPKNMLLGTGPETFAYVFLPQRPQGLNQTSEWDFLYNKAHNEYVDILVEQGLLGLTAYIFLIGSFITQLLPINYKFNPPARFTVAPAGLAESRRAKRARGPSSKNTKYKILNTSYFSVVLLSGWVGFLVTNFFGFSVVPTALLFWLYPAISLAFKSYNKLL